MKVKQLQDSNNQHLVAIEQNGELRCFFKNASLQTAGVALENLLRDITNHGESVVDFAALPIVTSRTAKTGRTIYDVQA